MNEKELRELDAWIAEHVMGYENDVIYKQFYIHPDHPNGINKSDCKFSTDRAAALQVLEKCAEKLDDPDKFNPGIKITKCGDGWWFDSQKYETLPLGICMFAKKLFSK